jgi:hypothetical protein
MKVVLEKNMNGKRPLRNIGNVVEFRIEIGLASSKSAAPDSAWRL